MLIPEDDLMIHQTSQSLGQPATTDLRFFERFIFLVHDRAGKICLATGLGAYPNMRSMDGFACVVTADSDEQRNARFYRELAGDRSNSSVGPLSFTVLEPMKRWRLALDENPYGLQFDLEMEARFSPWKTHLLRESGVSTIFDMGHFVQAVTYTGQIIIDGKVHEADGDFAGARDRSWGVRPLSGFPMPGNSALPPRQMHIWANPQFEDSAYFIYYHEGLDEPALAGGIAGGRFDGRHWTSLRHTFVHEDQYREHVSGTITLTDDHGDEHLLHTSQLLPGVYLKGGGYNSTQGMYRGNLQEGEVWPIGSASAETKAGYGADGGLNDQLARFRTADGREGVGILETQIQDQHPRYPRRSQLG